MDLEFLELNFEFCIRINIVAIGNSNALTNVVSLYPIVDCLSQIVILTIDLVATFSDRVDRLIFCPARESFFWKHMQVNELA